MPYKITESEKYFFWKNILEILESVPNNDRSQYHTQYLNEVKNRVDEHKELSAFLKKIEHE